MKKFLKWLFVSLCILSVATTIFVVFFLKDILLNKLKRELKQTFGNYYSINYKSIETSLSLHGFTIKVNQPTFKSDTSRHDLNLKFPTLFFHATSLELNGLSIRKLLFSDDLKFHKIKLHKPVLKFIIHNADSTKPDEKQKKPKPKQNNSNLIIIQKFDIENGIWASCHYNDLSDTTFMGIGINACLENINTPISKLKSLVYNLKPQNNFLFSVSKAFYKPYKSNYFFYMDSLLLNDKNKTISAKNISESTLKSKLAISKTLQFAKTIAETKIGSFLLRGYNIQQLILQNSIFIQSITLNEIDLDMFKNKRKQLNFQKEKLLLQEIFTGLPFRLKLDSVNITNSKIYFELIDNKSKTPVSFHISNFNALLTHINTSKSSSDTMVLKGDGKFMNAANFNINAVFPNLFEDDHYYTGYVGPMSFSTFNKILYSYSGIKIIEGNIRSIVFKGMCNKYENSGTVIFKYNDLVIEVEKTSGKGKKQKAHLISRLVNMALLNNNPRNKNQEAIAMTYYFRREKYHSHVMLWVSGILEGVKNTLLNKNHLEKGMKFLKKKNKKK